MMRNLFLGIVACCGTYCDMCECTQQKKLDSIVNTLLMARGMSEEQMKNILKRSETLLNKIKEDKPFDVSLKSFLPCYELLLGKHITCLKQLWIKDKSSKDSIGHVLSHLEKCMSQNKIDIPDINIACSISGDMAQVILTNPQLLDKIMANILKHRMKKSGYKQITSYWISDYKREYWGSL